MRKLLLLFLFCGILFAKDNIKFQQQGNTSNTVGLWHFNEGSGTTAYDSSGSENHGTLSGNVLYTLDGILDRGLHFSYGEFIKKRTSMLFSKTQSHTLACWVKLDSLDIWQTFVSVENVAGYQRGTLRTAPDNKISFVFSTNLGWVGIGSNELAEVDKWYFVCGVATLEGGKGNLKLYVNGILQENQFNWEGAGNEDCWHITVGWNSTANNYQQPLKGFIDEVFIYTRALSAAEIAAIYQQQKGRYVK